MRGSENDIIPKTSSRVRFIEGEILWELIKEIFLSENSGFEIIISDNLWTAKELKNLNIHISILSTKISIPINKKPLPENIEKRLFLEYLLFLNFFHLYGL